MKIEEENIALVGFSINTEINPSWDERNMAEKAPLDVMDSLLGGTSANVAKAIRNLGGESKILGLIGEGRTFSNHNLNFVLETCDIPYRTFVALSDSNIALVPDNKIHPKLAKGKKGEVIKEKVEEVIYQIKQEKGKWRIATGVREPEIDFVQSFFEGHAGFRTLNPRAELINKQSIFKKILAVTDLLILNESEYAACQVTSPSILHNFGPALIIVTEGKNGGMFAKKDHEAERFESCKKFIDNSSKIYTLGSGDWFNGAFSSKLQKHNIPINDLLIQDIRNFIEFSAIVAGKKVTMDGPSNGPTIEEIERFKVVV